MIFGECAPLIHGHGPSYRSPRSPLEDPQVAATAIGSPHSDRFAVAVTPGLDLVDPQPIDKDGLDVLMAGVSTSVQGCAALPNVERELADIADRCDADQLLNGDFSGRALRDRLARRSYDIVHIASHGVFERTVDDSFLLTHDARLTLDQLETFLQPARFRDRPVELLTLSACQTAPAVILAALFALSLRAAGLMRFIDLTLYDWSLRQHSDRPDAGRVVVIGVGDEDLQETGYPPADGDLAALIVAVAAADPAAIGVDILAPFRPARTH